MPDPFASSADALYAPSTRATAVSPHDVNELPDIPKALYVGTAGDIAARGLHDIADQIWRNVPAGAILPFRARFIRATGTTAADILALY